MEPEDVWGIVEFAEAVVVAAVDEHGWVEVAAALACVARPELCSEVGVLR